MTPTLPIELQLRITDLALPPRTSTNFPTRRDRLISFSLVHRSWTAHALLYEANDWHALNAVPSLRFLSSGAFPLLRFLSISHMTLPFDWHDAAMPSLHTLLLTDVGSRSVFDNLGSLKSLRVLGAKADFGDLLSGLEGAWPSLQHLAVVGISIRCYDDVVTDDSLPESLSSITVLHLPSAVDTTAWPGRLGQLNAEFDVRCAQLGVKPRRRVSEKEGMREVCGGFWVRPRGVGALGRRYMS
ncbi:hypothetical protein JCM10296v2_002727 [Rhodotorula toruloides]